MESVKDVLRATALQDTFWQAIRQQRHTVAAGAAERALDAREMLTQVSDSFPDPVACRILSGFLVGHGTS